VELGVGYPTEVHAGLLEHERQLLAFELNAVRRQLADAQRAIADSISNRRS
jgi:hypothetical protein